MYGKPYHKMPLSSWMTPGGNRDKKRTLIKAQKYPTMSAIQKNLGGPLSDVFFSNLTPSQLDNIGFTPTLQGPGKDLWVSPSDMLVGKIVLTPPYTIRVQKALSHQGIMEMGAEIEEKLHKRYQQELEDAMMGKEWEMKLMMERMINEAVEKDRREQKAVYDIMMERAATDINNTYQETLADSAEQLLVEGKNKMEKAVERTKKQMQEELCNAVNSRTDYLGKQFEFQMNLQESDLLEKYQMQLKKHHQECRAAMEKAHKDFVTNLKKIVSRLEAEHISDLLVQSWEKSKKYHEEKRHLETCFSSWFMEYFDVEIDKREFSICELEEKIRQLQSERDSHTHRLAEVFRHFQKFINFALKEKPGQAEFLLSVEKELSQGISKVKPATESEILAKSIIDFIIKRMIDKYAEEQELDTTEPRKEKKFNVLNFRSELEKVRNDNRKLELAGEGNIETLNETEFINKEKASLANMFEKSRSLKSIFDQRDSG